MTSCHSLIVDMDEAEWSRRQNWLFCQGVKALRLDKARRKSHVTWPENISLYKYNRFIIRTASFQQSDMVMPQKMMLQVAKKCSRQCHRVRTRLLSGRFTKLSNGLAVGNLPCQRH